MELVPPLVEVVVVIVGGTPGKVVEVVVPIEIMVLWRAKVVRPGGRSVRRGVPGRRPSPTSERAKSTTTPPPSPEGGPLSLLHRRKFFV